jgi:AraC family transcriptional regulator
MEFRIENLKELNLVGIRLAMSLGNNKTGDLWRTFMPRRKEISNHCTTDLFSMQVYPENFDFKDFNIDSVFEKWAAVEVADLHNIPEGMESFQLKGGLYAVFHYIGAASEGEKAFRYIFEKWLPESNYTLDNRPHFEILGSKYKNNDPSSEEEIWIPIKVKE